MTIKTRKLNDWRDQLIMTGKGLGSNYRRRKYNTRHGRSGHRSVNWPDLT